MKGKDLNTVLDATILHGILEAANAGTAFCPMPIIGPFHGTMAPITP